MSATPVLLRTAATSPFRGKTSFAVTSRLEYSIGRIRGEGITVRMSSSDISFKTSRSLPVDRKIRLCIHWPAVTSHGSVFIAVTGRVLRSTTEDTTVQVLDYKCQTKARPVGC